MDSILIENLRGKRVAQHRLGSVGNNPAGRSGTRAHVRNVLLYFGPNYSYSIHQGVAALAGERGWHLGFRIHSAHDESLDVAGWDALMIATALPAGLLSGVLEKNCPVLNLSVSPSELPMPRVVGDNRAIGAMAARHYLDLGYRNFAYFSFGRCESEFQRGLGFQATLRTAGHEMVFCSLSDKMELSASCSWRDEKTWLRESLQHLPKPVGVFCFNDLLASHVLDVALDLGLMVPEEVAILGVDDDPLFCEKVAVPLSSVQHDLFHLGYRGAEVLHEILNGTPASSQPILLQPTGVRCRRSTDHFATSNPALLDALRFIQNHFKENISVEDVVKATPLSVRALQYSFQRELKRSIRHEINRQRLDRAVSLLRETNLAVADVAAQAGFSSLEYFCRLFQAQRGCTALAFRKIYRQTPNGSRPAAPLPKS